MPPDGIDSFLNEARWRESGNGKTFGEFGELGNGECQHRGGYGHDKDANNK